MKQLFLTSSVNMVAAAIAQQLDLSQHNKLVFIDTAAEPKEGDLQWLHNDRQALVEAGFAVSDYTMTGKSQDQLEKDLIGFEYIYLSGGDTYYLFQQSVKSGFMSVIRELINQQGKTYIGTSAGSIMAGTKFPNYLLAEKNVSENENIKGYGLVNFTILPHWGSDHFKEKYLGSRLKIACRPDQVPLILLTDTQYVHVRDEQMQIVDVRAS
jgi:dipeptidase E